MFSIFKYRIKAILNDRSNLFWTFLFPILLATAFSLSFGSVLTREESFQAVPVAVIENSSAQQSIEGALDSLDKEGVLDVRYTTAEQAEQALAKKEVSGVYEIAEDIHLTVDGKGINQSILKSVSDGYLQLQSTISRLVQHNPQLLTNNPQLLREIINNVTDGETVVREQKNDGQNYNYYMQNFYALLAMTCLYGSFFGLSGAVSLQGNLSALGARRMVAPVSKIKLAMADMCANILIMFIIIVVFILYMVFALKIEMGNNVPAILLVGFMGCFVGVVLGMMVGFVFSFSESAKNGILIAISLGLSALGGMVYPNIRYEIEQVFPIANRINPASLIVDSLYSLDTYGVGERFGTNMLLLTLVGVVLFLLSVHSLRRRQYESL